MLWKFETLFNTIECLIKIWYFWQPYFISLHIITMNILHKIACSFKNSCLLSKLQISWLPLHNVHFPHFYYLYWINEKSGFSEYADEHDIFWLCTFHNFSFYSMPILFIIIIFLWCQLFHICFFKQEKKNKME